MLVSLASRFFTTSQAMCIAPDVPSPDSPMPARDAGEVGRADAASRSLPPAADPLLAAYERANESVESGGRIIASRLVTTAGPGNPASFGRSQLLVRLQVDGLLRLERAHPGTLAGLGLEPDALRRMDVRGRTAEAYYDALVRGRVGPPLGRELGADLVRAGRSADAEALVRVHGPRFEAETGIPAEELRAMLSTRLLVHGGLGASYRALRSRGVPATDALDTLARAHPELEALRTRLGDSSVAYFLARPRRNGEHAAAWYTRAVRAREGDFEALTAGLVGGGDALTSRARSERNLGAARRLVSALPGAGAASRGRFERAVLLVARLRHGSPAFVASLLGADSPGRVSDFEALEQRLASMATAPVTTPDGDHGRSLRAFAARLPSSVP